MKLTSCNKTGPRGPAVWVAVFVPIGAPLPVVTCPALCKQRNKRERLLISNCAVNYGEWHKKPIE